MASVRFQAFAAIEAKLEAVREALDWLKVIRDPREPIGEDEMNALVLATGGEPDPDSLTGGVEIARAEFSVGLMVIETAAQSAEELLDQGFVAVCNALQDPGDMQLANADGVGLVNSVLRKGMSAAMIGRSMSGARIIGAQSIDFEFEYMTREGDVETPGP